MVDEPTVANEKEYMAMVEEDERRTIEEEFGKLTPREYAKARGMQPQLVYYYIRTGVLKMEPCICGRNVIDTRLSDEALQAHSKARGQGVDAGQYEDREG